MEAASRGASEAGGTVVGVLPGTDRTRANRFSDVTVVTGIGHARNLGVVASADVVVAVGGEWGTLSEIGLAGVLGRPVVLLAGWRLEHESGMPSEVRYAATRGGGGGASRRRAVKPDSRPVQGRTSASTSLVARPTLALDARRCRQVRGRVAGTLMGVIALSHRSSRPRPARRCRPIRSSSPASRRCRPSSGSGGRRPRARFPPARRPAVRS